MTVLWFKRDHGDGQAERRKLWIDQAQGKTVLRDDPEPVGQTKLRGEPHRTRQEAEHGQRQKAEALQKHGWQQEPGRKSR